MSESNSQPATKADLDRFAEMIADEFSQLRREISSQFQSVYQRLDIADGRAERMEAELRALAVWAQSTDRRAIQEAGDRAAQQAFIEDLARRVAALEKKLGEPPTTH